MHKKMYEIKELQKYFSTFDEGYGTEYERYALDRFVPQMIDKYSISNVLEMPANGVMGIPGIKSLIFAKLGCNVTVAHPSKEFLDNAKKMWEAFGLEANFVKSYWVDSEFKKSSFDLVWNFCVFEHFDDPKEAIQEMLRITKKYVFIEIQNVFNPGFPIHRLYHFIRREPWDHGNPSEMKVSKIRNIINKLNATIVETGATDMPPWPDINIKFKEMISRNESFCNFDLPKFEGIELNASRLRPEVKNKKTDRLLDDIKSISNVKKLRRKDEIVFHLFGIWYFFIEKRMPSPLKIFFAHHPYVIAEKKR